MFLIIKKIYLSLYRTHVTLDCMWNIIKSFFYKIIKARAYALMALSSYKKNALPTPGIWDIKLLDGGVISALFCSLSLCGNFILACIISTIYFLIFPFSMDLWKSSSRYYILFRKLPYKTRLRWRISVWAIVISLYLYAFAILYFQMHN